MINDKKNIISNVILNRFLSHRRGTHKHTAGLLSISCITDTDDAQNSASSLGAAPSVKLQLIQTCGDAALHSHSNPIPYTTETSQPKYNGYLLLLWHSYSIVKNNI